MKNSWHIPRRSFLRGLGVSLALPALEVMQPIAKAANNTQPPVRFLSIFQPNGVYPKAWDVSGLGRDYELSPILQPLTALRDDVLVISNLDNVAAKGHVQMTGSFLTGVPITNQQNGVSLDQQIAQRIGRSTRLPSIELGTEPPRQGAAGKEPIAFANTVSWSSPTTRVSPEINPRVAFDRLFADQTSPEARRIAANRKSVIDLVLKDARALQRRSSILDRHKIDEYLQSVRSIESQIDRSLDPRQTEWVPATTAELVPPPDGIPRRRDEHLKIMMDLMVLAFQTDTTRVGTLMTAHGFSRQSFGFLDGISSDHHGMSHHKEQEQAVAEYTRVSHWYMEMFAGMLQRMKDIDEYGSSLLDNSVVLYGSGMKDGNGHRKENLPILLAGKGGGRLQPGRHVVLEEHTPLANLLLTVAQKFDIETDSFNGASSGTVANV